MKFTHVAAGISLVTVLGVQDPGSRSPKVPPIVTSPAVSQSPKAISSVVTQTDAGEQVLTQEIWIDGAVADVWNAYVTPGGWTAWASPIAEIDLRAGGSIRTHYNPDAKVGDAGTNVLKILNYVPERILTLQAELADNWPDVMKEDAERLMNVIVFEPVNAKRTRVRSYGVGYGKTPAYDKLLKFFVTANHGLHRKLKDYIENGTRAKFRRN